METKEHDIFSDSTRIIEVSYDVKNNEGKTIKSDTLKQQTLESIASNTSDSISLVLEVDIPCECHAEFKFSSQTLLKLDAIDPIISLNPTTDMEIDLVFPYGISANALGIHPDPDKFKMEIEQNTRKRWRTKGLLPGQGILISLKRIPGQDIPQSSLESSVKELLEKTNIQPISLDED